MYVHTCDCCASSSENERSVILSCKTAYSHHLPTNTLEYMDRRSGCLVSTFFKSSAGTVVVGGGPPPQCC